MTTRMMTKTALMAALLALTASVSAQRTNPRFGRWKIKSDAPPPSSNIMTYEPFGAKGMKVTVEAVNAKGETTKWWYTTEFDGKDMPVTGQAPGQTSAVTTINDRDQRHHQQARRQDRRRSSPTSCRPTATRSA